MGSDCWMKWFRDQGKGLKIAGGSRGLTIYGREQKALKGRQHQTGRGPAGVPQTAKIPGRQTHSGQMGLGPGTQCPGPTGPGQRLGVAATVVHALLLPSQLNSWEEGRRPERRRDYPTALAMVVLGVGRGAEGTEALVPDPSPVLRPSTITLCLAIARAFPIRGN